MEVDYIKEEKKQHNNKVQSIHQEVDVLTTR